jgi:hypothetical protein
MFKKAICRGKVCVYRASALIARWEGAVILSCRCNIARIFEKIFFRRTKFFSARTRDQRFTLPARRSGASGAGAADV